jgi:hypothetical protein
MTAAANILKAVAAYAVLTAVACTVLAMIAAAPAAAAPGWQPPIGLSAAGENADTPRIALDPQGDAVAVWTRSDGTNTIIQAATRPAGGSWQPPSNVSATGQDSNQPGIALDSQGNAVAVWTNATSGTIQAGVRPAGGSWQTPSNLSEPGQTASEPQLALDSQGDAVAVWTRSDGTNTIIQAATRPAGGSWQPPSNVSATGQDSNQPGIALDSQGNAVAVWAVSHTRISGLGNFIQASLRPAGNTWTAPADVSGVELEGHPESPKVAADGQGDVVALWTTYYHRSAALGSAVLSSGDGAWQPQTITSAGEIVSAELTVDAQGDAAAVWTQGPYDVLAEEKRKVESATRPMATGVWRNPDILFSPTLEGEGSYAPRIATNALGDSLAIWVRYKKEYQGNPRESLIDVAAGSLGTGVWGPLEALIASEGHLPGSPDIAVSPQGDAVAVWTQSDGLNNIVTAADYYGKIAPTVVTEPASSPTQTAVTLNATVSPNGSEVSGCHFEYGTTASYGTSVPCSSLPGSGASPVAVSASVTSLSANTTYHFRIVATNEGGTSYGVDRKLATSGPTDFGRCIKVTPVKEGTKTVYHGGFTKATCIEASGTHTGKYEWYPGVVKTHFTTALKENVVTLETVKKVKVICTAESGSGEYSGTKEVASVVINLTGCESGGLKCTTPGLAEGELETKKLEGELGWENKALKKVALDLHPVGKTGAFMEYRCVGAVPVIVTGAVLVPVTVDKMLGTAPVKYKQTAGKQKPEHFEGGLAEVLTASLNGELSYQMGLGASLTQVNEEAVEINAVV